LPVITLLFTGVIVPARCVQSAIDARGSPDYIYTEVCDLIQQADLAVGTLNASINDTSDHTGCIETYKLVGSSNNADALASAGFDVMSVATNHIKNGGNPGFFSTLDNLRRVGIVPVGAGSNLEEALQPVVLSVKGVRFGIVSLGMIEPMAFAGADTPGIAVLTDENLLSAIVAARKVSDVVIAMPHWGPEDTPNPDRFQLRFAQALVEAGANLVVGNHTHVVQAVQEIDGITVFYGLGNFVFDQTWDLAHQQGVILRVTFEGTQMVGYELIPTHVDGNGTVHIAGPEESAQVLDRIQQASDRLR
jgi:poly-gamma-glutamate synthesis protein (capsule biosynthesis protein)